MSLRIIFIWIGICLVAASASEDAAVGYIESCRKPNGAFGPVDQAYTNAAWNYPAVAALKTLGRQIANADAILQHGVGRPKGHAGAGHWQFFHKHRIQQLLDAPMNPEHQNVRLTHQGFEIRYYGSPFGTGGDAFFNAGGEPDSEARDLGFYNLSSLYYLLGGLEASGREAANSAELVDYVRERQAPNGGFVDIRVDGMAPMDAETHVAHTFQAIAILNMLSAEVSNVDGCADYLRGSLAEFDDVYHIWTALHGLKLLGRHLPNSVECAAWINTLQNHDGGFGDRPGWRSRLYSTFYAVDALSLLGAEITTKSLDAPKPDPIPDGQFEIYQALFKTPEIAPSDLAALNQRGFNLLGLKSSDFALAEQLRDAIRRQQLPMDVVLCPEAYPHRATHRGGAVLHHVANPTLDPAWNDKQRSTWLAADAAGAESLPWTEYQSRVLQPLQEMGSLIYPEQDFEMEFAYESYDTSYNAMLVGFNWAPSDFVRVFPWRERYIDRLVLIADADAHGDLAKWSPQLDHTRNLYLADSPSYANFQKAAAAGRVVCVIAPRDDEPAALYGQANAVTYAKKRIADWRGSKKSKKKHR